MIKIVMATNNNGKIKELKSMLSDNFWVMTQREAGIKDLNVDECGMTFEENAIIKANSIKDIIRNSAYIIAEDSGICIDCLNGYPGVKTKRAALEELNLQATDYERNEFYINKVANNNNRKIVWQTVIALIDLEGKIKTFTGEVEGVVAKEQAGDNGFGFDAMFFIPQEKKTLAQLTDKEKERYSARKRAVEKLVKYLEENNL